MNTPRIFRFERHIRTYESENYTIYRACADDRSRYIATLDIHIKKIINCTLILTEKITEDEFHDLLWRIEQFLCSINQSALKYIIQAYNGDFIGEYGKDFFDFEDPVNKHDLNEAFKPITSIKNKFDVAKGQLIEIAACDYFNEFGYNSNKASSQLDHQKIDIIGKKGDNILYAQVKLGEISEKSIDQFFNSISNLSADKSLVTGAIVADKFPNNSEILRHKIEDKYKIRAMFVHKYQVIHAHPQYKRAID